MLPLDDELLEEELVEEELLDELDDDELLELSEGGFGVSLAPHATRAATTSPITTPRQPISLPFIIYRGSRRDYGVNARLSRGQISIM